MQATDSTAAALEVLFDLLPTNAVLLAPVYDAAQVIVDFTFHRVNPAAQRMLGLPARPTATLLQHMPQHGPTGLFAHYCQAFASGERIERTFAYQGEGFDSAYQLAVQRAGDLLVTHYLDLITLSTEAARQELHASQARERAAQQERARQQHIIETVFEQAPAGVWVVQGPDYVFELYNPQMGELLGPPPAQALGRPYFEVLPELASQGIPELLRQVSETGEAVLLEEYAAHLPRHAPGQVGYFTFVFQPLRDAQGYISRISCVALDVTAQVVARQRVEQANQELEARVRERTHALTAAQAEAERQRGELQRVFEQAPLAIAVYRGPAYTIELANPTVCRLWGRRPEDIIGRGLFEALPEVAGMGYEELLDGVMQTGQPVVVQGMEAQHDRHGRRETVFWDFVYVPMAEADGRISGAMVVATEVTAQVRARRQIEQLNHELEARVQARTEDVQALVAELQATNAELYQTNTQLTRTNADLDTFVYTASHDLKAPIANIEGLLNALHEELPAAEAQRPAVAHLLHLVRDSVARFQHTLGHLANVAELQQVGLGQPDEVDLATLIEHVRLDLAPAFEASKGQLRVTLHDCAQPLSSFRQLRSIVFNLVSNALKYCHPDRPPVVLLTARCTPSQVALTVQDNGLGMSPEQLSDLFRLFRRLHTHVEGSGVGLYSIKKLIDNAGGTIEVASELGMGSTFTVRLPR